MYIRILIKYGISELGELDFIACECPLTSNFDPMWYRGFVMGVALLFSMYN